MNMYDGDNCNDNTNKIYITRMKTLNSLMTDKTDKFYISNFYDYEKSINTLETFFKSMDMEISTIYGYMIVLCKYLKLTPDFPSDVYVKYFLYVNKLHNQRTKSLEKHKKIFLVDDFLKTQEMLKAKLNECKNVNLKIIIKLIASVDIDTNDYGILRMNDLIGISLFDKNQQTDSYLNLDTGELNINKLKTKNKIERNMYFSVEFCQYVKELYQFPPLYKHNREWLLSQKFVKKCTKTSTLSNEFHKFTGITYYDIRRQFITYIHGVSDMTYIKRVAFNMGHRLGTAILYYNRTNQHADSDDDED